MKKTIALLLAATLTLGLCACSEKTAETTKSTVSVPTTAASTASAATSAAATTASTAAATTAKAAETTAEQPHYSGGVVGTADGAWYEIERAQKTYQDGAGSENTYSYAIPAFNSDSADASAFNAEIADFCNRYVSEMKANETAGTSLITSAVSYQAWQNGEIVSILLEADATNDIKTYKAFNLNLSTGKAVTGAEMIAAAGLTEAQFVAAAQKAATEKFKALYGATGGNDFLEGQYAKTMSADAYSLSMPMYFGEKGKLCVIATIYAMAGADSYDYPLTVN